MDLRLRTRYRDLLEDPADPERIAALRGTLAHAQPSDAAALRDQLIGAYYASASWENLGARERRHLRFAGPGLLAPVAPKTAEIRWRESGSLVGVNHSTVLLEDLTGALVGHDLATGEVLWRVPSAFEGATPLDASEGRWERLGWAAAPWGAVELLAEFDAPLTYRRRGRYHAELGRVTERAPVDRLDGGAWMRLQVLTPLGEWGLEPALIREDASGGEGLCDGQLSLAGWDDSLYELELDPSRPSFAVRTLEQDQGEGHAFLIRDDPTPRVDPIPWRVFPELHAAQPAALTELQTQTVSRGDTEWSLDPGAGRLQSSRGGAWETKAAEPGQLDLVAYADCAWVLGPGPQARIFELGQSPRIVDLSLPFDGRSVGGPSGMSGFGLEGGLLLQAGRDEVLWLSSD
ncbi:MAG: hypothetical protein JKY65_23300 [Planctomycetes bacterium]|nr:hypothetical protein [Planctomycetota bacterium]